MKSSLSEFELIERFFYRPATAKGVVHGQGDDCAILRAPEGFELAVSTDMLIEGRHFLPGAHAAGLGHKALAVNLSDLAACGAKPWLFFLSLGLPRADRDWLAEFSRGLFALADEHGIAIAGGDTTKSVHASQGLRFENHSLVVSPGPLCLNLTVLGLVPTGTAILRSGASAGDELWVSGTLGGARLALGALRGEWALGAADLAQVSARMHTPSPRTALGQTLRGTASAALDVSDGLVGDLQHLLRASKLDAVIDTHQLPLHPTLGAMSCAQTCALYGGDDYELVFSAPATAHAAVMRAAKDSATQVTCIGQLHTPRGQAGAVQLRLESGELQPAAGGGFDHFSSD